MEYKVNIGDVKSGKSYKVMVIGDEAKALLGTKIGDKVKGDKIGFSGYEFEITGGSDSSGFPMRKDVSGNKRQRILIVSGVGTRQNRKGMRLRRTVVGNTVGQKTSQVNMKVLKAGKKPLDADTGNKSPEVSETESSDYDQKPEVSDISAEPKPPEAESPKEETKPPKEEAKSKEEPKAEEKLKEDKKEEAPAEKPKEEKPEEKPEEPTPKPEEKEEKK